jgi:hypothetical protein
MEAIMGCKVYFSSRSRWTEPAFRELPDTEDLEPDESWVALLLSYIQALQESSKGRWVVCNPLMRGPIDVVRALIGDSALATAIYDDPERLAKLIALCTSVNIQLHSKIWERIPPFASGWCTSFGIWAPGTVGYTQIDASELFSPRQFRDHILPHYRHLFASRDYMTIHTHSISHRHLDALLTIDECPAIQVAVDPPAFGPAIRELIPVFRRVQEVKPLLISGPVTQTELGLILDSLSPRGLALMVGVVEETGELPPELMRD